jgi:hypothetical protein
VTWGKLSKSETLRVTRVGQEESQPNLKRVRRVLRLGREFQEEGEEFQRKRE